MKTTFCGLCILLFGLMTVHAETKCPLRWVHVTNSLVSEGDFLHLSNVVETAATSGFNGLFLASGINGEGFDFHRWNLGRRGRLQRLRELCETRGIEIIPSLWSVGRAHAIIDYDFNLAEALPMRDIPYVCNGERATFVPEPDAVTWLTERPTGILMAERKVGSEKDKHERRWIDSPRVKTAPYRRYRLTFKIRTTGVHTPGTTHYSFASVEIYRDYDGKIRGDGREGFNFTKGDSDWTQGCLDFVTCDNVETRITMGFAWRVKYGKVEFADVDIRPVGLQKLVRREGAPMIVRSAATGRVYAEGRDWLVIGRSAKEYERDIDENLVLRIPSGSAITQGEKLLVSAYTLARRSNRQAGVCMANPDLYEYFDESMAAAVKLFGPCKRWFLPMDEIRTGGTCAACEGKALGDLLADCLCRQRDIIRKHVPGAEIYVWPDMFSPYGNARKEKADRGYQLCASSFWPISKRIPKDIVAAVWSEANMSQEFDYFNGLGLSTIYAGYYDAMTVDCPRGIAAMRKMKKAKDCRGYIYSTWTSGGKYDLLREYGEALTREFGPLPRK